TADIDAAEEGDVGEHEGGAQCVAGAQGFYGPRRSPVNNLNSRDNPEHLRLRPARAYIQKSPTTPTHHALHAKLPRRAEGAASGFGSRRPARQAEEGRARVEGAVAVQQGEDRLVLRQRPETGLVRLLLRQERLDLRLRHDDRGGDVPR